MATPSEHGLRVLEDLVDALADGSVAFERSQMFGAPGLRLPMKRKFFCCLVDDAMIFKLDGEDHARALALDGSELFDPGGGRPMKQWVQVPLVHEGEFVGFATSAARTVGG